MTRIQTPPILSGSQAQQLVTLHRYLFTMSRQLEQALSSLDETNFTPGSQAQMLLSGGAAQQMEESIEKQAATLRSLIVKSADTVRAEMDAISARLRSGFVSVSDYGSFTQSITNSLDATAERLDLEYDYRTALETAVDAAAAEFDRYVTETNGCIRFGIVDWDGNTPVFGVAVGQGITATTVTVDGKEWAQIDNNQFLSVFTAQRLSFRQNDVEVAYLSNEKLYITTAHITGSIELGGRWEISRAKGFAVKWVG